MLALGARGLVNAQFIVRDDGVYLIEVNPRASRTVPFMSKVTGVPMVELAVRISLGATLAGARLGRRACSRRRRSSRSRRRPSRRPSCAASTRRSGRGCSRPARSSASHTDPRVALAKALLGAALVPPRPGADGRAGAALDRRPRQGRRCRGSPTRWRGRLSARGDRRDAGGAGGRRATRRGRSRSSARQPDAAIGEVAILDLIAAGEVRLVVNTPTPRSGAVRDAAEIRLAATAEGILCLTAMETAVAAAEALDPRIAPALSEVRSLEEWVPGAAVRRPVPV